MIMRKIIRIGIIILFILALMLTFVAMNAVLTEASETEDDIFGDSLDFAITAILFFPIFLIETDLFYDALYFASDKKTPRKTGFNIAIIPVLVFIGGATILLTQSYYGAELILFFSLGLYFVLRTIYIVLLCANKL